MKSEEFRDLEAGDIVQHKASGTGYVVTANYRQCGVLMVKTLLANNPDEWEKISKPTKSVKLG